MKKTALSVFSIVFILLNQILTVQAEESPRFPILSIAPELGYQFLGKKTLEDTYRTSVGPRHGAVIKAHVDIGGDKWGLEIAPLYAWQGTKNEMGALNAFGGEVTMVYRFKKGAAYPGVGLGFHATYLFPNDKVQHGLELMGRVPLGLTWYFLKYIGLVVEGGFLFGATGIRFKNDSAVPEFQALNENTEYAFTMGFDLMIGLRFP